MQNVANQHIPSSFPVLHASSANSLCRALDTLGRATQLNQSILAALRYLEFIYAGAIDGPVSDLRRLLAVPASRITEKAIEKARTRIRQHMERYESFPFPLNRGLDEERVIIEAVDVLQDALDQCLDKDMHTQKVREALRFLVWKDGNTWEYKNFWNALTFQSGQGNWQNADHALNNIRKVFGC